ncbi:uncharacterized protein BXZ73DRAFT_101498 [Epithele typhae]|uniref:uncharacterized protein n=1 Tax=Epithele typhae TaxID=378194 RepID=UPI002007AB8F|nr:uncharacterized protein BXZ73DRAFT_101498 [Epithele typhae]KAH9932123.1 hypothetical protein BXZ73DRAFT_101498 [Epithele typhae]
MPATVHGDSNKQSSNPTIQHASPLRNPPYPANLHYTPASPRASSESRRTPSPHIRPGTPSSIHSSSSECGDNDIIPPYHPLAPRTLVLCFDGTGDQFDSDNSNVVKFFSLLKRDDRREQMTGIGTYTNLQMVTSIGASVAKTLDEAIAWNLESHVMEATNEAGDKICLFGFSRGAYTARALAGMLHKMYSRTDEVGWQQSTAFKKAFSVDVSIEFIGVWDTVSSVGLIPHRLPFTTSNTAIRTFRHALSLDERRAKFKANHWNRPTEWEARLGTHPGEMPRPVARGSVALRKQSHARTTSEGGKKGRAMSPKRIADALKIVTGFGKGDKEEKAGSPVVAKAKLLKRSPRTAFAPPSSPRSRATRRSAAIVEDAAGAAAKAARRCGRVERGGGRSTDGQQVVVGSARAVSTFARKPTRKRMTEEEETFDRTALLAGETDVKEVWFAGCHADVGGGSVSDTERHSLARIPLRWMVRECFRTHTGIRFHAELLKDIGLDPAALWPTATMPLEFGPGLAHAPQLPPLIPAPGIALEPATPPERPREHVEELEQRVLLAMRANAHGPSPYPTSHQVSHRIRTRPRTTRCTTAKRTPAPPATVTARRSQSRGTCARLGLDAAHARQHTPVAPERLPRRQAMDDADTDLVVNEVEEERRDAMCQLYDQLALKWFWWVLEIMPLQQRMQRKNATWKKFRTFNMGRGRAVPLDLERPYAYVHRSVKHRMEAANLKGGPYKPKASFGDVKMVFVD